MYLSMCNTLSASSVTYISMNIDPNGRTPPRIMITRGSMNLQDTKKKQEIHSLFRSFKVIHSVHKNLLLEKTLTS